ncbi:MAG: HEAT repeat domain-containing protein [Methanobacteriaceae archaeon]|nr:HEAT repeat domain-containing protein [Methanobacteriaceae archaeon]
MFKKQKSDLYKEYDLISCRKQKSLRPEANHQKGTIKELKSWFEAEEFPSGSIIALPTGSGKTFTAVRFLCRHVLSKGYKVLWLAHTHHLLEQAFYSFGPAENKLNDGYEVGWIQEPKNQLNIRVVSGTSHHYDIHQIKRDDDIVIATLQSVANAYKKSHPKLEEFLKSAKGKLFVVFDEAHHSPAPTYRNLICSLREKFKKMYLLGLTATPTHMDIKKRGWLKEIFPQKIVYQAQVKKLMAENILARPYIDESDTSFKPDFDEREYIKWVETNRDVPEHIITQLASNHSRNQYIADNYIKNKEKYKKTIFFADRWYQCDQLSKFLQDGGVRAGVMYSRPDNEENAEVLEKFRNNDLDVIVNIKMLTEGTDVPDVDTVFITRQTRSTILMTQMVGRALRGPKFGGTPDANLVFFYDEWQKTINWSVWDTETWTAKKEYGATGENPKPLDKISIEAVQRLIDMMDRGQYVNPGPFLKFIPTGWYQATFSILGEDENPEESNHLLMVFENEEKDYFEFLEHIKNEDLKVFDSDFIEFEDHLDRIKDWCKTFFSQAEKHVGDDLLKNIFNIARHMAQNMKEPPKFIEFEERKNHDLDPIARKFIEEDYGPRKVDEKLRYEYNREDRYWKVIYYHYDLFKSQYNACLEYILSLEQQTDKIKTPEEIQVDNLKYGSLEEKLRACEILGEMGSEENLHQSTISLLNKVLLEENNFEVKKSVKKAIELVNSLKLSDKEKEEIKDRDDYKCLCCGESQKEYLQIDHISPQWYGIDNSENNLQTLCKLCNITKSTTNIDFRSKISPLENQPNEIPFMYRFNFITKEEANNVEWWEKFIKRFINFFYESSAVKSFENNNSETWEISLNSGNDPDWIKSFSSQMANEIKPICEKYGFNGPENILINGYTPKPLNHVSKHDEQEFLFNRDNLKLGNDRERARAARKLGKIGDERAVPLLIKAMNDSDYFVPRAAASSLGKIGDIRAIKPLIQKLRSQDPELRYQSKWALINIGEPSLNDLLANLSNFNNHVRQMVVETLGEIGAESSIEPLIEALSDDESTVRWRAAQSLGNIGDERALKPLEIAQNDSDEKVRDESIKALNELIGNVKKLFETFDSEVKKIDDKIFANPLQDGFSYYSPERVFLSAYLYNPKNIRLYLYIGNEKIQGIQRMKGDPNWGVIVLERNYDLPTALSAAKKAYELMKIKISKKS